MPNWSKSMKQTFEYYTVDPGTWKDNKQLKTVVSCEITRDASVATLGSATIETTEALGEGYVRVYLVTEQDSITEKFPLGTFLVQTPGLSFNGKHFTYNADAYTPLIELKEKMPPIGYSIRKNQQIMANVFKIVRENCRAPVVREDDETRYPFNFVANADDTWLTFLTDYMKNAEFAFDLDEKGRILFAPIQDAASLQPIRTYDDGNSSILYPEISMTRDLYGIPNAVEVSYSTDSGYYYAKVVNSSKNSPISTVNRGREIVHRVTKPNLSGEPTNSQVQRYAKQTLRELSTIECKVSYTHGYYPSRPGDCVLLDYERAGITDTKAKIISQTIKCVPGCPVTEQAVYTTKLWG